MTAEETSDDWEYVVMEEGAQAQAQNLGQWQGRSKKIETLLLMAEKLFYTCSKMP